MIPRSGVGKKSSERQNNGKNKKALPRVLVVVREDEEEQEVVRTRNRRAPYVVWRNAGLLSQSPPPAKLLFQTSCKAQHCSYSRRSELEEKNNRGVVWSGSRAFVGCMRDGVMWCSFIH